MHLRLSILLPLALLAPSALCDSPDIDIHLKLARRALAPRHLTKAGAHELKDLGIETTELLDHICQMHGQKHREWMVLEPTDPVYNLTIYRYDIPDDAWAMGVSTFPMDRREETLYRRHIATPPEGHQGPGDLKKRMATSSHSAFKLDIRCNYGGELMTGLAFNTVRYAMCGIWQTNFNGFVAQNGGNPFEKAMFGPWATGFEDNLVRAVVLMMHMDEFMPLFLVDHQCNMMTAHLQDCRGNGQTAGGKVTAAAKLLQLGQFSFQLDVAPPWTKYYNNGGRDT